MTCYLHENEQNQPLLEDGMARMLFVWEYGVLLEDIQIF
jgi:hypothetical protein